MEETYRFIEQLKRTRSSTAASHLVERYQNKVFSFCLRMVKQREVAEELAQDAFLKAFKNIKSLQDHAKFEQWLMKLTYHIVIDFMRKKKITFNSIEQVGKIQADDNPHLELINKDRREQMEKIFESLEQSDCAVLTLYYMEDKSIKQIEAITGLSQSNIKVKLFRTRETLRTKLQKFKSYEN